ncbi:MAG TPA: T9SS type A sorting domain-containing protein [Bacteroidia bacterium]|nr:T9SS type A sorting domain-containing protein [Bacteroidia bacterium]
MKTNLWIKSNAGKVLAAGAMLWAGTAMTQPFITYQYTGSMQTFTVPNCVNSVTVIARGAQGATAGMAGANGGSAKASGTVTPGQVLYLFVGGMGSVTAGGYNGGGSGGISSTSSGGGGGGASDVRVGGTALANRVLVAGGGGGSGGNTSYSPLPGAGGAGNAFTSASGYGGAGANGCAAGASGGESGGSAPSYGSGGGGGGFNSGGGGGGQPSAATGGWGCNGALGVGGAGGGTSFICGGASGGINGGGGGGGGYYGGGGGMTGTGGCNGGGGGGSSWAMTGLSSISYTAGDNTGNGSITVYYDIGIPSLSVSGNTNVCSGSSTTLTASGSNGTYTWSTGFVGPSLVITPTANANYSVAAQGTAACPAYGLFTVNIIPLPVVTCTASPNYIVCPGTPITLNGVGADTYTWTGGVSNGVAFTPSVSGSYTVIGTNTLTGCQNMASINVPIYVASVGISPPTTICNGETATLTATGANSYTWSTNSQFAQTSVNPSVTTVYTVNATSPDFCLVSNTTTVNVTPSPTVLANALRSQICRGESVVLQATGAGSYSWSTGASGNTVSVNPNVTTTYTVTGISNNCPGSNTVQVKVDLCLGIKDTGAGSELNISVYPNPSQGEITVKSPEDVDLRIINEAGQLIITAKLNGMNSHELTLRDLPKGIYFIQSNSASKSITQKFVVE